MVSPTPSGGSAPGPDDTIVMPIKVKARLRQRLKVAAAEEGMTYAGLLEAWLNRRDRETERARARQAHPLHRPRQEATTP